MAKSKSYEMLLKIAGKTDSSLKAACNTAAKNIDALGKTAKNAGKMIAGAAAAGAAAVGTIGVAAVKAASDYEAQLANVATLLTGTEAEVAARTSEIGSQIMEVSNRTGVATADLTDGMWWYPHLVTARTRPVYWKPPQNRRRQETPPQRTVSICCPQSQRATAIHRRRPCKRRRIYPLPRFDWDKPLSRSWRRPWGK